MAKEEKTKPDCYWVFRYTAYEDGRERAEGIGVISDRLATKKKDEFAGLKTEDLFKKDGKEYSFYRTILSNALTTEGFSLATSVTDLTDETIIDHRLIFKALPIIKDSEGEKIKTKYFEM